MSGPRRTPAITSSLTILAWLAAGPPIAVAQQAPRLPELGAELVRLGHEDQAARDGFGAAAAANDTAYMRRLMRGDSARTLRLKAIVREHGWPGRELVGQDGAHAAWLLLQHSPDTDLQRQMLPTLWSAAERGDVAKPDVALLTDRVLVRDGQPQRYGNSFSLKDGTLVPDPIADPEGLEARRKEVGLPPMAEYARAMQKAYGLPVAWPPPSPTRGDPQ